MVYIRRYTSRTKLAAGLVVMKFLLLLVKQERREEI